METPEVGISDSEKMERVFVKFWIYNFARKRMLIAVKLCSWCLESCELGKKKNLKLKCSNRKKLRIIALRQECLLANDGVE